MNSRILGIGLLSVSVIACGDDSSPGTPADSGSTTDATTNVDTTGNDDNSSVDTTGTDDNTSVDSTGGTTMVDPTTSGSTTDEPTTDDSTTGPPPGDCAGMSFSMLADNSDMTTNLDVAGLVSCNLDVTLTVTGGSVCVADDGAGGYFYTVESLQMDDIPPVNCGLADVGLTNLGIVNTGNYMDVTVDQSGGPMSGNQPIDVVGDVEGMALGMPVGPVALEMFSGVLPEGEVSFGGADTSITYSDNSTVIATAMPEVAPGVMVTVTLTGLDGELTFNM